MNDHVSDASSEAYKMPAKTVFAKRQNIFTMLQTRLYYLELRAITNT